MKLWKTLHSKDQKYIHSILHRGNREIQKE